MDGTRVGYARVSTAKHDLDRQLDALGRVSVPAERTYVDKRSGATTDRPELRDYACQGDVIVVHTLDRVGRTVRDTINLIHELTDRGVGVRNLADPIRIDTTAPDDPMAQPAVVLLALFGQMERTYTLEREAADTVAEIVAKTGIARTTLYRHLPPRPAELLTAAAPEADDPTGGRR